MKEDAIRSKIRELVQLAGDNQISEEQVIELLKKEFARKQLPIQDNEVVRYELKKIGLNPGRIGTKCLEYAIIILMSKEKWTLKEDLFEELRYQVPEISEYQDSGIRQKMAKSIQQLRVSRMTEGQQAAYRKIFGKVPQNSKEILGVTTFLKHMINYMIAEHIISY